MTKENQNIKILSIESSGPICGVAISEDERLIAEYSIFNGNLHDKMLAELVRRILSDTSNSLEQIDAVAVSSGPGSFTGLRIGASIAKALCYNDHPKLIAVPTLTALAFNASKYVSASNAKGIIAIMPSHKNFIYYQHFENDAKAKSEIIFADISTLNVKDFDDKLICGPYKFNLENGIVIDELLNLKPSHISSLALKMYNENQFVIPEEYVPLYVQDFHPKVKI